MRTTSRKFETLFGGPEEMGRYLVSGGLGTILFYGLLQFLYVVELWPAHNAGFSWFLAYGISILWTHRFHRWMTFRWENPYWRSLRRTYVVYAASLAATTALVTVFVEGFEMNHHVAFVVTLLASGCVNYLSLRNWGFRPE